MDRKRGGRLIAGLLALGVLFFVGRTCKSERAAVTLVFSIDSSTALIKAEGQPRSFEATLLSGDDVVGTFYHTIDAMSPALQEQGASSRGRQRTARKKEVGRWKLTLDSGRYQLEMDVVLGPGTLRKAGRSKKLVRVIEAVPRGTIHILLAPLSPKSPTP